MAIPNYSIVAFISKLKKASANFEKAIFLAHKNVIKSITSTQKDRFLHKCYAFAYICVFCISADVALYSSTLYSFNELKLAVFRAPVG